MPSLQLEILCSGPEDLAAAQAVLKVMYTHRLELDALQTEEARGSQSNQLQLLVKVGVCIC